MTASVDGDASLLDAWIRMRDQQAFQRLCDRYAPLVAAACRRLGSPEVDDAAQAVFLILSKRAAVVPGGQLAGWLHGTARRVVAHQRRAASRRRRHEKQAGLAAIRAGAANDGPAWSDLRPCLDEALSSLSEARREAILRFYLQGKPQATVAVELGCSVDAVKSRVHEGLERLRLHFARRGLAVGSAALAAGLASESAAAEPALADACARAVLGPIHPPAASSLAHGVRTTMIIKRTAMAAIGMILIGSLSSIALLVPSEAAPPSDPPVAVRDQAIDPAANAALDWWRAIHALPADDDEIWTLANSRSAPLPNPLADSFFGNRCPALDLMHLGSADGYCEWGVDVRHEGSGALVPYLQEMQSLLRLAALRARWHVARAEHADAVREMAGILRASRLLPGRRPMIIEALVGMRCEAMAISAIARVSLRIDAAHRRELLAAIGTLPAAVDMATALDRERELMSREVERLLLAPADRRREILRDWRASGDPAARPLGGPSAGNDEHAMSDAGLRALLEAYPAEISRWQEQLRRPLRERLQLAASSQGGDAPPHPLMALFAPSVEGINGSELRQEQLRAQLIAALRCIEHGERALAEQLDPVTGKPFRLEQLPGGFRLSAELSGAARGAQLLVGEIAQPEATAGATDF